MKVLILPWYGRLGPSSRMRTLQYLPWLDRAGIEYEVAPLMDDGLLSSRIRVGRYDLPKLLASYARRIGRLARRGDFDLIWLEKEALPWLPASFERWLCAGIPCLVDYDDAVFHHYDLSPRGWVRRIFGNRVDRVMSSAAAVMVGNKYLAARAENAGAHVVREIPTVIDLARYAPKPPGPPPEKPTIVWIGTFSTAGYLRLLREPLSRLRSAFKLRVIGGPIEAFPELDMELIPWTEKGEAAALRECDIGVMPLTDSPWERGKCGYKLIQYMACGLPVVASPVGVNREIVRVGENGFLADSSAEWVESLDRLLDDPGLRRRMGEAGRKRVEQDYCTDRIAPAIIEILRSTAEGRLGRSC
jgi:glycosyltransferase involved in cell wall biosynthesis